MSNPKSRPRITCVWRYALACLLAGYILCVRGTTLAQTPAPPGARPNVIFILADDLGYGDLGSYGQQLIRTPNLDRMAAEGTRFTQCYAGSTVCAPSRCALMTGYHMGHARIRGNAKTNRLFPEDVTVAEALKGAGYSTALIGKWGLGNEGTTGEPKRQGFDYSFGYLDQTHAHDYWTDHLFRDGARVDLPPKTYSHDLFTDEALGYLRRQQGAGAEKPPFFLYLAYTVPHQRFDPPTEEPYGQEAWPPVQRKLAAMVTRMDRDVGRLMDVLKESGLDERTLVLFSSDNGPRGQGAQAFKSSGPLRGIKRDLYEGGIRVPMIARWPGRVPAGRVSDQVWAFWDVLPTLAELAGAQPPAGIDGISIVPALLGKTQERQHELLYWEFFERGFQQAARAGDWKAVRLAPGKPLELYELSKDPGEQRDVAGQNLEAVGRMEAMLNAARTDSPDWPTAPVKRNAGARASD